MNLEQLKTLQMAEILEWAEELDHILTPNNMLPSNIKEYPSFIEKSERLKRICDWKAKELKSGMQDIEDAIMSSIESAEETYKHVGGLPVLKKKYNTLEKQKRELRLRLKYSEEYQKLALEHKQWKIMYSDWVSHVRRLEKEYDLLEVNYHSSGGEGYGI